MPENVTIYHNPRCGKSRNALKLLQNKNFSIKIVEYLKNPPSVQELKNILFLSEFNNMAPFIRKKETIYKEKFAQQEYTNDEWCVILHENPVLIERPIIITKNKAIIARTDDWIKHI